MFLITGRYRTLMERLGKVLLVATDPNKKLSIDYTYTQRIIFFSIVTDTMKAVLPYLKIDTLMKFLNDEINLNISDNDFCIVCKEEDIVTPIKFQNCQHLACYVCFKGLKDQKCPSCKN